jgi:NTP pyrophosphatase (non-canonical NTP hydrolase)
VSKISSATNLALRAVWQERKRQDEKWGEQNHSPEWYYLILAEEVGEVAQAILQTRFGGEHGGIDKIAKEVLHVAAVAVAMLECLDRNSGLQELRPPGMCPKCGGEMIDMRVKSSDAYLKKMCPTCGMVEKPQETLCRS